MNIMHPTTGWRPLITLTTRLAHRGGTAIRHRADVHGRLLFEAVDASPDDYVRGVLATAYALSGEICHNCGGPGDPVKLQSGRRTTLCADCRRDGDQVLRRPPWRREPDPADDHPVLESIIGTEDLAALMEAKYTPDQHTGWPVTIAGSSIGPSALLTSTVGHPGWNHLVRAALTVLLPHECPGTAKPWRLVQLKEKLGRLTIHHHWPQEPFYVGVTELMQAISPQACIRCGRPGRLRNLHGWGWIHPACDPCWKTFRPE